MIAYSQQPIVDPPSQRTAPSLADMDWLRSLAIDARSPELVSAIDSLKRKYATPAQADLPSTLQGALEASEPVGQQYRYRLGDGWSDWVFLPSGTEPIQQDNLQYRFVYGGPACAPDTFRGMWAQVEKVRASGSFSSVREADVRPFTCSTPPVDLLRLADELDRARDVYVTKFGTDDEPAAKEALSALLWDDKGTFAAALRLAARAAAFLCGPDGARAFDRGSLPDRDMLVRAIALVLARYDVEPSSDATLKLYREEAEFIADGLSSGSFPLQLATRRWRHKKRGSSYAEIGRATSQSAIPIVEGETVVVYVADVDGSMHVRKDAEFEDGRFQEIVSHSDTQGSTEATR